MNDPIRRRGFLFLGIAAVITVIAVIILARGGDDAPPPPIGIVPELPEDSNAPVEQVRPDPAFIPETGSPSESEIPDAPSDMPRGTPPPRRSTDPIMGGGEEGMIQDVSWPDRRALARQALAVAPVVASLYGRDVDKTLAFLRPRMTTRALSQAQARLTEGYENLGTKPTRVKVTSANLRNDPGTGARSSIVGVEYPGSSGTATVYLEFSATDSRVVDWQVEAD